MKTRRRRAGVDLDARSRQMFAGEALVAFVLSPVHSIFFPAFYTYSSTTATIYVRGKMI